MIILDTSVVIELVKGTGKGKEIQQRLWQETVAITTITIHEILLGARKKEKEIIEKLFAAVYILSYDQQAAHYSAGIEQLLYEHGKPIGRMDIFIAAICLANDVSLLTLDKGFTKVDHLRVTVI